MASNAPLLFIVGADRPGQLIVTGDRFTMAGSTDLYKLLGQQPFHRLQITPNFFRQARQPELDAYRTVLNLITEPEGNDRVLDVLRKLLRGMPARVVNHPDAVRGSTRDRIAKRLADVPGLIVPKAIRLRGANPASTALAIERACLAFPVIIRRTGTHTGNVVGRFEAMEEAKAALAEGSEHIATEFVDFRSDDGLYRKYRVFCIGDQVIFRHMLVSDNWNVHAKDRTRCMAGREHLIGEEKRMFSRVDGNFRETVRQTLAAVRERMALDFFGVDFGLAPDGRAILFEANATMNFFPSQADSQFAYWEQCVEPARSALRALLGLDQAAER